MFYLLMKLIFLKEHARYLHLTMFLGKSHLEKNKFSRKNKVQNVVFFVRGHEVVNITAHREELPVSLKFFENDNPVRSLC